MDLKKNLNDLNLIKYDKWSGDKTRNTDIFGKTQISINLDSGDGTSQNKRVVKELPSIIVQNRVTDEDLDNRDSMLLNSVRLAADETVAASLAAAALVDAANLSKSNTNPNSNNLLNQTTGATNQLLPGSGLQQINGGTSSSSQNSAASATATDAVNLEVIIMQKLLKHEKKATTTTSASSMSNGEVPDSPSSSNSPKTLHPSGSLSILSNKQKRPHVEATTEKMNGLSSFKHLSMSTNNLNNSEYKNGLHVHNNVISNGRHIEDSETSYLMNKKRKLNNGGSFLLLMFIYFFIVLFDFLSQMKITQFEKYRI